MSLLSVTVKKARYVGMQATQYNTYVTLKLQNVKSTTVTVKGPTPCWEQDFLFETNDINSGLLVEVWNKGVIWDRALGYHWLPLTTVAYANDDCGGRWVELEAHLVMRGGAVVGTTGVTGHALLLDCRFELPFDAEGAGAEAAADLQRKLDLLNGALDAERAEQARRQMQYIAHSGYSEDSDYTSDLNYPVGQHANCSASQFRNAAHSMHTPQRSLEVSRENSYEREEYQLHSDADPLYYNSRPRTNRTDWQYDRQADLQAQASVESAVSWRTAADWTSGEEQRRPSLERQNTLYDDVGYGYDGYSNKTIGDHSTFSHQPSYEEFFDSSSYPYHQAFINSEEHRQWDSGGIGALLQQENYEEEYYEQLAAMQEKSSKRRSSVVQLPQIPTNKYPASSRYSELNGMAPYIPRQRRTAASLPVTPSSTPRAGRALPRPPTAGSGSGRHRRLPRVPGPQPAASVVLTNRQVPYNLAVTEKTLPTRNYSYDDGYDYQQQDYQDNNYSSYPGDDDGMQPFFNETPHATPPAAQKMPWSEADTTPQFKYPTSTYDSAPSYLPNSTSTIAPSLPQLPAMARAPPASLPQPIGPLHPAQPAHTAHAPVVVPAGKESTVLAGAQTLGLLAAGGAKKLASGMFGSLFGAAAHAPTTAQQPRVTAPITPTTLSLENVSHFGKQEQLPPALTSGRPGASLPRAPSLRRQDSLQRPAVRRLRSLPDAPDDPSHFDEYYPETATELFEDRAPEPQEDVTADERFREEDNYEHERPTEMPGSRRASSEVLHRKSSQEAFVRSSPARNSAVNGFGSRKPSVDSYAALPNDRRTSAQLPNLHNEEEKPHVPTSEAEPIVDKNGRASVQERTSYQDEKHSYHDEEEYQEPRQFPNHEEYPDEPEDFHREGEKFDQEQDDFQGGDDYQEEEFQEEPEEYRQDEQEPAEEDAVFEEVQPKLTPRQLWHRAYNKIIRQLNTSAMVDRIKWVYTI